MIQKGLTKTVFVSVAILFIGLAGYFVLSGKYGIHTQQSSTPNIEQQTNGQPIEDASLSEDTQVNSLMATANGATNTSALSMIVAGKKNDNFYNLAKYFAKGKKARMITFTDLNDLVTQLKKYKPTYLSVVLSPQALTPDFVDELDLAARRIDADPYFDVAYGIITSFDEQEGFKYVDRLLAYKPAGSASIYGINQYPEIRWLGSIYGLNFQDRCVGGYGISVCDKEHEATVARLVDELKGKNIVNMGLHGSPMMMSLGSGESLVGNTGGLMGVTPTDEIECQPNTGGTTTCGPKMQSRKLNFDAALLTAYSCTTARINGKPSVIKREFDDTDVEGKIENSVVLSALKSGALDYIGATHVANSAIFPLQTISEEAILQGIPVGTALKDFKNNYVFNKIFQQRSFPGKPVASQFTIDFIEFQLRNWVLFGDPSMQLTTTKKTPQNCIQKYIDKKTSTGKEISFVIKFTDANGRQLRNTQLLNLIDNNTTGASGNDGCAIRIPLNNQLPNYQIKTQGINSRFESMFSKTNGIIENLGDELLIVIPDFVLNGGSTGEATIMFSLKK